MRKEVSCVAIRVLLEYAERQSLPIDGLCAGVPYTLDYLKNKQGRIEWEVYCRILANLRPVWSDDDLEKMGFGITNTIPFRILLIVPRLLFRGPEIYFYWVAHERSPGKHLFDCITSTIEQIGKNHIVLTLMLPPGYQYCREFFLITKGTMAAGTAAMGLGPARVSMRETERGAIYDIICPEGGGALSWLRRAIMWPFAARAAARELKEANEALHERYAQLEEAREKVQRQATQLKVAYDISRLIHANLDLDSTLEAIASSLVTIAGFAAAALSLDTFSEHEPVKRAVKTGRELPDFARVTRTLDSHGVKFGEVTLWIPPGSDLRAAEDLLDYVIPTISMEIDDALSFKLVNDYRNSLQQKVEKRTQELKEMNESLRRAQAGRDRLFANISHEFRTPLTLILGPIQKWCDRAQEEDEKRDLQMAERNAQRLLRLINQLLDLSKLEAGAMKLRASRMNIVPLVKGIAYSFESSAGIRGLALNVHVEQEEIDVYCDKDMVEKILSNLLSNAFKFTPAGGTVKVEVSELTPHPPLLVKVGEFVEISVADTGVGIPPDQLDKVFDRFYQVDVSQTRKHEGSGLGLELVKELVELHHGTIHAQSEVGKGTEFTVRLPLGRSHLRDDEIVEGPVSVEPAMREVEGALVDKTSGGAQEEAEPEQFIGEKPVVLVVEDNADVRAYIKDYLVHVYQVTEARDGAEGIEKAEEIIPDLIISDVMMPKKDGYEVCRTLKLDEKTSHIPIILLTAKAASENKIEGLETGADDYLIKPFEPKELLARIKNLINLRRKLRDRFKVSVPLKPGEIAVTSMDDVFLNKVIAAVEQHMGDERFHIDELGALVGMSGRQLHRKLSALTNQGPGEFIRYIRLHRAMDLLQKGAGTVSEIAYRVGFSDPSYFSKCFHQQFGNAPTDVRKSPAQAENSDKTTQVPS